MRGSKVFLPIILLIAALFATGDAQKSHEENDTLAMVGGVPITASEFVKRFELAVYPHKGIRTQLDAEKERFLFSLIAEQLLANEAEKSGLSVTPESRRIEDEARDTFLRDALYREAILSKIKISDKKLLDGMRKARYKYLLDIYVFPDGSSAESFRNAVLGLAGSQIDSFVTRNRVPHDTMRVVFGELDASEEDSFWGRPVGFMTGAIRGEDRYAILRVANREDDLSFQNLSLEQKENAVRKTIETRMEVADTKRYVDGTFRDVRISTRRDLMSQLVDSISSVLSKHPPNRYNLYLSLYEDDVQALLRMFGSQDSVTMMSVDGLAGSTRVETIPLEDVIQGLVPSGFYCKDASRAAVFSGLDYTLRHFVEYHLLVKKAREAGLNESAEVRDNVDLIMKAYLAAQVRESVLDTVRLTRSDLDDYMQKYNSSELSRIMLTLLVVTAHSMDDAVRAFGIVSGDSGRIAAESVPSTNSIRIDTITTIAFAFGGVGAFFSQSEPGEMYGPVQDRDGGLKLYKLLSKISNVPDTSFAFAVDTTKMLALAQKREKIMNGYVASLASKGHVKVFIDALKKTEVEPLEMFTVRKIGFGGQMNAVPGLAVCEDWTRLAPMQSIVVP